MAWAHSVFENFCAKYESNCGGLGMLPKIFEPSRVSSEAILAHTVLTYTLSVQMCARCKVNCSTTYGKLVYSEIRRVQETWLF